MKKIVHPNEGHQIPDYYVDGINRAFIDNNNLVITLDSISGIESHDSIFKNEIARLVIPALSAEKLLVDLKQAVEELVIKDKQKENARSTEPEKLADKNERLGSPFQL